MYTNHEDGASIHDVVCVKKLALYVVGTNRSYCNADRGYFVSCRVNAYGMRIMSCVANGGTEVERSADDVPFLALNEMLLMNLPGACNLS